MSRGTVQKLRCYNPLQALIARFLIIFWLPSCSYCCKIYHNDIVPVSCLSTPKRSSNSLGAHEKKIILAPLNIDFAAFSVKISPDPFSYAHRHRPVATSSLQIFETFERVLEHGSQVAYWIFLVGIEGVYQRFFRLR